MNDKVISKEQLLNQLEKFRHIKGKIVTVHTSLKFYFHLISIKLSLKGKDRGSRWMRCFSL